jgi:hypothetical protein
MHAAIWIHKKMKDPSGKVCKKRTHNAFEYNQIRGFRVLFIIGYCLLCTAYCILCTAYCVLFTAYCILFTAYCVLRTVYCVLCTAYCALHTVHCILCTVHCELCFGREFEDSKNKPTRKSVRILQVGLY